MRHSLFRDRWVSLLLAGLLVLGHGTVPASVQAVPAKKPKSVPAAATVLMDADTTEVLAAKNPDVRRPIASTTKIVTAIVVVENAKLNDVVRVPAAAARVGESSAELAAGERRTVRQLLYALMLKSANDAATALAIYVAKSLPRFSKMMNARATQLGARRTHFVNPHGLTAPGNYSTARDLALVTSYALKNPVFARLVRTKRAKIPWPKHSYPRVFKNHNRLLWDFAGAVGVKTGFTIPAGHCLVGAARRGDTTLVAVTLGAFSSDDALNLTASALRRGFAGYRREELLVAGRAYGRWTPPELGGTHVNLVAERAAEADLFRGASGVSFRPVLSSDATLPVAKGETLGRVEVRRNGAVLATAPLASAGSLDAPSLWDDLGVVWSRRLRQLSATAEHGASN